MVKFRFSDVLSLLGLGSHEYGRLLDLTWEPLSIECAGFFEKIPYWGFAKW